MKISLVQNFLLDVGGSPNITHLYPHLGLISLIAALEGTPHTAELYDPLLQIHRGCLTLGADLYEGVAYELLSERPDAIGFTALGCNFIAVLKIARIIKQLNPRIIIILGGPHATVLDREIIGNFREFDFIVRGEAEQIFPSLLDAIENGSDVDLIPGLTYRLGRDLRRSVSEAPLVDVDALPSPAYHKYPIRELGMKSMRVEAGRGCPFNCTYCSTATFFGRKYRIKSAPTLVGELDRLKETYGIEDFSLQHDLFTVSRKKVLEFCEEVRSRSYSWSCSARIDCVDPELLREMSRAGCRGIYYGIETGSSALQMTVKKRLKLDTLLPILRASIDTGLNVTTSFITGFPEETESDLAATLDCMENSLRVAPAHVQLQLHLLTPEPGTALYHEFSTQMLYDGHISDFNFPTLDADEPILLSSHPDVFMNHHYYPTKLPRRRFVEVTSIMLHLFSLGGTLIRLVLDSLQIKLRDLIESLITATTEKARTSTTVLTTVELLVRSHSADNGLIADLVSFAKAHAHTKHAAHGTMEETGRRLSLDDHLVLDPSVTLVLSTFDIPAVLEALRSEAYDAFLRMKPATNCHFVVYKAARSSESKTLRISEPVGQMLDALKTPTLAADAVHAVGGDQDGAAMEALCQLADRGVISRVEVEAATAASFGEHCAVV